MTAGRCGNSAPTFIGGPPELCVLLAGHAGWHRSDQGGEWNDVRSTPTERPAADNGDEVERAARAIFDAEDSDPDWWDDEAGRCRRLARVALAARRPATEAEETREEWGVLAVWQDTEEFLNRGSEEMARVMADYWNGREDGPTCTVKRRTWTASPWLPVDAAPDPS